MLFLLEASLWQRGCTDVGQSDPPAARPLPSRDVAIDMCAIRLALVLCGDSFPRLRISVSSRAHHD
jgi:hypothetical protein